METSNECETHGGNFPLISNIITGGLKYREMQKYFEKSNINKDKKSQKFWKKGQNNKGKVKKSKKNKILYNATFLLSIITVFDVV